METGTHLGLANQKPPQNVQLESFHGNEPHLANAGLSTVNPFPPASVSVSRLRLRGSLCGLAIRIFWNTFALTQTLSNFSCLNFSSCKKFKFKLSKKFFDNFMHVYNTFRSHLSPAPFSHLRQRPPPLPTPTPPPPH